MKRTLVLLCLALAAFGLWLGHLGYFGGPVFTTVAATAPAAPEDANTAVILLSGDMGSKTGMSPKIAERLAARGIPVTLVNSLSYFRHKRTPAEASALIAAAIRQTLAAGNVHRLVLMGQSYGADMLHVGLSKLSPDLRAKVSLVTLIVPENSVDYRASPSELFSLATPDAAALPTASLLRWAPVACIHGEEEEDSLCPILHLPVQRTFALPGGHPLRRDADALFAAVMQAMHWAHGIGAPLTTTAQAR